MNVGIDIVKKLTNLERRLRDLELLEIPQQGSQVSQWGQYKVRWTHKHQVGTTGGTFDSSNITFDTSTIGKSPAVGDIVTVEICLGWRPNSTGITITATGRLLETSSTRDSKVIKMNTILSTDEQRHIDLFLHWAATGTGQSRSTVQLVASSSTLRVYYPVEFFFTCWTPV